MSRKLLWTTVVLVVITVLVILLNLKSSSKQKDFAGRALLTSKQAANIDSITIENQDKKLVLEKKADLWIIKTNPQAIVDSKKLFAFISKVMAAKIAYLIGNKREQWNTFRLYKKGEAQATDKNTGVFVNLSQQGKTKLSFVIGKEIISGTPPRPVGGNYIRLIDGINITASFAVKTLFLIQPNSKDWENKTLLQVEQKNIKSISLENQKENIVFSRAKAEGEFAIDHLSSKWEVNHNKLGNLIASFVSLHSINRLEIGKLSHKAKQVRVVELHTFDDETVTIQLYQDKKQDKVVFYAMFIIKTKTKPKSLWLKKLGFDAKNWVFEIPESTVKEWLPLKQSFLQKKKLK